MKRSPRSVWPEGPPVLSYVYLRANVREQGGPRAFVEQKDQQDWDRRPGSRGGVAYRSGQLEALGW